MATWQLMNTDMSGWAPVTRHIQTSDGDNLAIETDDGSSGLVQIGDVLSVLNADTMSVTRIIRPTLVFVCSVDGEPVVTDGVMSSPMAEFPAGTTYETALDLMGYEGYAE